MENNDHNVDQKKADWKRNTIKPGCWYKERLKHKKTTEN